MEPYILEKLGKGYREVEEDGVYSPVMSVSCEYKRPNIVF